MKKFVLLIFCFILFWAAPVHAGDGLLHTNINELSMDAIMAKDDLVISVIIEDDNPVAWVSSVTFVIGNTTIDGHYGGETECSVSVGYDTWKNAVVDHEFYYTLDVSAQIVIEALNDPPSTNVLSRYVVWQENGGENGHTHVWEKVITDVAYVNINSKKHEKVEEYILVCSCGETGDYDLDRTEEPHTFYPTGKLDEKHYPDGHFTIEQCICNATRHGPKQKKKGCCECYGHQFGEKYLADGEWWQQCRVCGKKEKASMPDDAALVGKASAVWENDDDNSEEKLTPHETPRAEAIIPEIPGLRYNKYTDFYEANGDFRVDRNLDLGGRGLKILNGKLFVRKGGALINCGTIFCDGLKIENGGALYSVNGSVYCESGEFIMEKNAYAAGLDSVFSRSVITREESILKLSGDIIAQNEKKEYGDVQLNGSLSGVNRIECKSFSVNKTAKVETAIKVLKCHQDLYIRNGKDSALSILYLDLIPGKMQVENNSVVKLTNNTLLQVDGNTTIEGVVQASPECVFAFSNELKIRNATQISCGKIRVKGNLIAETERIGEDKYISGTVQLIKNKADKYINLDANEIIVDGKVEYSGDFSVRGTIRMTAEKPQFKIKWLKNGTFEGTLSVGKAEVTSMKDDRITFRDLDVEAGCLKAENELTISKNAQKDLENQAKNAAKTLFDSYHLIHTADGETATLKWEDLYNDIIDARLVTIDVPDESEVAAVASIRDGFDLTDWGWGISNEYKDLAYQLLEDNLPYQSIRTVEHFNGIGQKSTKVMDITSLNFNPEVKVKKTINGKKGTWHLEGGIFERTGVLYLKSETGETIRFTCTYNLDKAEKAAEDLQQRGVALFQEKQKEALKSIVKETIKPYEAGIASIVAETRDGLAGAAANAIYKLTGGTESEVKDRIVKSIQDNPGADLVADVYKTYKEFENTVAITAASGGNSMNSIYSTMKSNTQKQFDAEKQRLYKEYINPNRR